MVSQTSLTDLEKRIEKIERRNKKVELDKAWETSLSRRIIITFLTYFVIVLFFSFMNIGNPWINSLVPTIGFILSTMSLEIFKNIWIKIKQK